MSSFRRTRLEAILTGSLWLGFAVWVITVSYRLGYQTHEYTTTLGLPTWIVWGVLVPWLAAVVMNTVLAFAIMADDE